MGQVHEGTIFPKPGKSFVVGGKIQIQKFARLCKPITKPLNMKLVPCLNFIVVAFLKFFHVVNIPMVEVPPRPSKKTRNAKTKKLVVKPCIKNVFGTVSPILNPKNSVIGPFEFNIS